MPEIETIVQLTLKLLEKAEDKTEKILSSAAYWLPLVILYDKFSRASEIVTLSKLPQDKKNKYWSKVKNLEKDKLGKIMYCQALYMYDLISEK